MATGSEDAVVSVFPPARHGNGQAAVFLYRRTDPLVVDIVLWGQGNDSLHRSVLRADLLDVIAGEQLLCGDVAIAWVTPRFLRIVVQRPERTVVSIISASSLIEFLTRSVAIVPNSEEAETAIIGRLARDLINAT